MHIYAFGSVCRGEIDIDSDIDLLAIVNKYDGRFDSDQYSIYSYKRIKELWQDGNPFAWHLSTESRLIYSSDGKNFLSSLGIPSTYRKCADDCQKFYSLFCGAFNSIEKGGYSLVFELSTIFLSIRNFATCYLLGIKNIMNFSRYSAIQTEEYPIKINETTFDLLMRARILSIRAKGKMIHKEDVEACIHDIKSIRAWMEDVMVGVNHGRI